MKRIIHFLFALVITCTSTTGLAQTSDLDLSNYFLQSEIDNANTAKSVDYLTSEEQKVYLYTNLARQYPKKFERLFRAFVKESGKEEKLSINGYYSSLSKELIAKDPVAFVHPDAEMFELAKCWALESGKDGLVGHDRVKCVKGFAAENCAYGYASAQNTVMQLLIDDGVKSLGHRKNIFHVEMKGLGVAIRPHRDIEVCKVQNFSRTNDLIKGEGRKRVLRFLVTMDEWDKREFKAADVNRKAKHLNDLEKDFYLYINLMRVNPKKFKEEIWDKGPYLDPLQEGVQAMEEFKVVSRWLESAEPQEPIEPDKNVIANLQCFIESFQQQRSNGGACFKGSSGSSRLKTYYATSQFDGFISILLTQEDFQDIFIENNVIALQEGDPSVIAFFEGN